MNQIRFALQRPSKVLPILMIVAFMLAFLAPSVSAEEKPAESGWEFHVAPYLWAIAMDGNVTVKGFEADVNMSFSDIWDQLNFALMLAYEARKGNGDCGAIRFMPTFRTTMSADRLASPISIPP